MYQTLGPLVSTWTWYFRLNRALLTYDGLAPLYRTGVTNDTNSYIIIPLGDLSAGS